MSKRDQSQLVCPSVEIHAVEADPTISSPFKVVPLRKSVLALTVAALTLAPTSHVSSGQLAPMSGAAYTVLQMNLCLSGAADCYESAAYPSVVEEATAQVIEQGPSAVTLNEVCSTDVAAIARRTGYHLRFSAVRYRGAPIPCVKPDKRGIFGLAVLTNDKVRNTQTRAFAIQSGEGEERRWLCTTTIGNVTVCTAHLSTRDSTRQRVANDAECQELRRLLKRREEAGATLFGGDVNRQETCAPDTMWTSQDNAATQSPGIQHIYGGMSLPRAAPHVATASFTDHDFLLAGGAPSPDLISAAGLQ